MKRINPRLVVAGVAGIATLGTGTAFALSTPAKSPAVRVGGATPAVSRSMSTPALHVRGLHTPNVATPRRQVNASVPAVAVPMSANASMTGAHNWGYASPSATPGTSVSPSVPSVRLASRNLPNTNLAGQQATVGAGGVAVPQREVQPVSVPVQASAGVSLKK